MWGFWLGQGTTRQGRPWAKNTAMGHHPAPDSRGPAVGGWSASMHDGGMYVTRQAPCLVLVALPFRSVSIEFRCASIASRPIHRVLRQSISIPTETDSIHLPPPHRIITHSTPPAKHHGDRGVVHGRLGRGPARGAPPEPQPARVPGGAGQGACAFGGRGGVGWVGRSIDDSSKESGGTRGTGNALTPLPHTPLPNPADRRALLDLRRGHVQDGRQVRCAFR